MTTKSQPFENQNGVNNDCRKTTNAFKPVVFNNLLLLILGFSFFSFSLPVATTGLDPSLRQSLGYLLKNGFQAGKDFVFTFGPLGYFYRSTYDSDLFGFAVLWEVCTKLLIAYLLILFSKRLTRLLDKTIYFSLLIFVISCLGFNSLIYLSIIVSSLLLIDGTIRHLFLIELIFIYFVLISLVKFTFFMLVAFCLFLVIIAFFRFRSPKISVGYSFLYLANYIVIWVLLGQSISNIFQYLFYSLHVASCHSEASINNLRGFMVSAPSLPWGIISFVVCCLMLVFSLFMSAWNFKRSLCFFLLISGLFLSWKSGFVRPLQHEIIFYTTAMIYPFLVCDRPSSRKLYSNIYHTLRYSCVILCIVGLFVAGERINYTPSNFLIKWKNKTVHNVRALVSPSRILSYHDRKLETAIKRHSLPHVKSIIGLSSVDIMSYEQHKILLNQMNWQPRPVFQSYLTNNQYLLNLNADYFRSSSAPEFIVYKLQTIDNRFPTIDDSEALKVVLRKYRPIVVEKSYLLFKQRKTYRLISGEKEEEAFNDTVKINQKVFVDFSESSTYLMSIDIRYTFFGYLRKILFRAPSVVLNVETTDGMEFSYQIIPAMVKNGFIFNPLLRKQNDIIRWLAGEKGKTIASFTVSVEPEHFKYFKENMGIKIETDNSLRPLPEKSILDG